MDKKDDLWGDIKMVICECGCNTLIQFKMRLSGSHFRGNRDYWCPNCSKTTMGYSTVKIKWVPISESEIHKPIHYTHPKEIIERDEEIARLQKRVKELDDQVMRYWESQLS